MSLTILADDLTGACDTGSLFAGRAPVPVTVWPDPPALGVPLRVIDTETRGVPAQVARDHVRDAIRTAPARRYFKKIDSTLRGRIGAEVEALLDETRAPMALVCPAFPAQGRTVVDGILLIDGRPVAETAVRHDPEFAMTPPGGGDPSSVVDVLRSQVDRPVAGVAVSGGCPEIRPGAIAVADAETDSDLDALVAAAMDLDPPPVLVGSAGLGGALARRLGVLAPPVPLPVGPWLIVVGSLHPTSRRQAERARQAGLRVLASVDVRSADPGTIARQLAADALRLLSDHRASTPAPVLVAVTGGETALALYRALDADRIDLVGAPVSGLALGRVHVRPARSHGPESPVEPRVTHGAGATDHPIWLLTKAGGFGDLDVFISLARDTQAPLSAVSFGAA